MTRKSKFILFFLGALGFVLIAVVGLVWYVLATMFDSEPHELAERELTPECRESAARKIRQIRDDVLNTPPGEVRKVNLNKGEMDALLDLCVPRLNQEINKNLPPSAKGHNVLDLTYEDGGFTLFFSKYLGESNVFGDYVNLKARMTPFMKNGRVALEVESIEAGELGLPSSMARTQLDALVGGLEGGRSKMAERLFGIVTDVRTIDDSLSVSYYPAKIRELIGNQLNDANLKRYLNDRDTPP